MADAPSIGVGLEARVQRVFLAEGMFAERRLQPAADLAHRFLATDIDVLVSEYRSGFHLTRRHAECKGGKVAVLDRILWLHGLRALLRADASYLVLPRADQEASRFARALDIEVVSLQQLDEWERALGIPGGQWPCRSDFQVYETARAAWARAAGRKKADDQWQLLREVLAFIEIDSWFAFGYRHLNRLFRHMNAVASQFSSLERDREKNLCSKYAISALLVRGSQYLLAICKDLGAVPPADRKAYLAEKLTFGDQDPVHVSSVIRDTVRWIRQAVVERGGELPAEVDVSRLFQSPSYSREFEQLLERLMEKAEQALFLPVALEASQFNACALDAFPALKWAALAGDDLAAVYKGFVIRNLGVPADLVKGMGGELRAAHAELSGTGRARSKAEGQLTLGQPG